MENNSKDYVINLRVSRATYDKIKQKAKENQESISNLVRKAIDDSTEIIADLSSDLLGKQTISKDIVGYHKSKAAQELTCVKCGTKIGVGDVVTVGETEGAKKYFFCKDCN